MIKLIIFDLDGPILDSWERSKKSVDEAVKKLIKKGVPLQWVSPNEDSFIGSWGYPGMISTKLIFPNLTKKDLKIVFDCWAKDELRKKIPLVEGALKVLKFLKGAGYKACLLTSRSHNLKFHLSNYDLENMFDFVQSWKHPKIQEKIHKNHIFCRHHKPNPSVLNIILKWADKNGIHKNEALMIDDTLVGLETAKAAGLAFLGVCTGPLDSKAKWLKHGNLERKYVINSIADLPGWLEENENV